MLKTSLETDMLQVRILHTILLHWSTYDLYAVEGFTNRMVFTEGLCTLGLYNIAVYIIMHHYIRSCGQGVINLLQEPRVQQFVNQLPSHQFTETKAIYQPGCLRKVCEIIFIVSCFTNFEYLFHTVAESYHSPL